MTQFECRSITDEDLRLFIGYSATPLPGGGVGFIATRDRKRCWLDYSAPTPEDLIAKLDAEFVHGTKRRHWVFLAENEKWGLSIAAREEFERLMAEIPPKAAAP